MNTFFLVALTIIPLLSFAQSKEEAQKILDNTKVHYLNVNGEFDRQYPVIYLDKNNNKMGTSHEDKSAKLRPFCHINAKREKNYDDYRDLYWAVINDLRNTTNIERLKIRRDGETVNFYYEQADPWFEEYPVITCGNVKEKNPLDHLKKLYDTTSRYESIVNGKRTVIQALHPNDPSTCIVEGEEYVKLDKLMKEVTSFGSLELKDRIFIDGKIGTIVSMNKNKGQVRFGTQQSTVKTDLFDVMKVSPARDYKYRENVRVLGKKPFLGNVLGQVIEKGEIKILVSTVDKIEAISPSIIMKTK